MKDSKFLDILKQHVDKEMEIKWEGTLKDYIELIIENPELNMGAHQRVLKMIEEAGVEKDDNGNITKYNFFEDELFGLEESLEKIMSYLKAAAAGSEVGRRILLLYGPTSSGKSQLVILLKRGLELFSKQDSGAIYCLADSPMYEDPLTAIPQELRGMFKEKYGVNIVGEMSPIMSLLMEEKYEGDFLKLPVKRYTVSERNRRSIGTFVPSDKKSQDISELVGSMDLSTIGTYGAESDPRAFKFDGELNIANRGLMEFVEMLKVDQKFLYVLLTLAQEKNIKTGRFPLIFADEFVIAHSIVGDEPIIYKNKNGFVECDTIKNLTEQNKIGIEVMALNKKTMQVEWTKVTNFYSHPFTGSLVKTMQKEGVIETTHNHSIIDLEGNEFYPEEKRDVLSVREIPDFKELYHFSLEVPDGVETDNDGYSRISDIPNYKGNGQFRKNKVKTQYSVTYKEKDVAMIKDLLKVMAWYITEGHVNSDHCIISQNSIEELQMIKRAAENISTSVASLQDRSDKEDKTSRLHLSTKIWKEIIELNCGKYSSGKKIPNFLFNLPKEFVEYFFWELMKGDGYTKPHKNANKNYENNFFSYKTVSKTLAAQVGFLASLIGLNYSVGHSYTSSGKEAYQIRYREAAGKTKNNKIEGLFVESLQVYDIACEQNHTFAAGVGQIMCHNTNETEYNRFLAKKEMEALHDRTIVVRVPYNLNVENEIKIYRKLIGQAAFDNIHIAPHTLECAALFSVLSRLKESSNQSLTLMKKIRLYNKENVEGFTQNEVSKLKKEFDDEGMDGISPRYVINRISSTLAESDGFITPIDAIRSLRDGLSSNPKIDKKETERLSDLLTLVIEEYNKMAKNDVQKAFFVNFEKEIHNLLKNYLDQVEAYLDNSKVEDEWGNQREPDERLMRSVEEKIQITETGKRSFRQEIFRKMLRSANENGEYSYQEHPKLKEALEKQLFDERQDIIRLTVSSRNPDEDELKRVNGVINILCEKHGYVAASANQLLKYVSSLMARN